MMMASVEDIRIDPISNLLAGGVGGLLSLLVGHPFDTVKVRLQTMKLDVLPYQNARDCVKKIVRNEGFSALYRGMSILAFTSVPRFALITYVNTLGRRLAGAGERTGVELTLSQVLLGGILSQIVVAPLITSPLERVKVLLQAHPDKFNGRQSSCLAHIVRIEGIPGIFKGSLMTLARDIPAFCSYFSVYELLRPFAKNSDGQVSLISTSLLGGLSGVVGWGIEIPLDNIKNRHQANIGQTKMRNNYRDILSQGGVRQMYRGTGVILLRAFPANAVTFIGYEWTLRLLVAS